MNAIMRMAYLTSPLRKERDETYKKSSSKVCSSIQQVKSGNKSKEKK